MMAPNARIAYKSLDLYWHIGLPRVPKLAFFSTETKRSVPMDSVSFKTMVYVESALQNALVVTECVMG
jgi:hypothetical protein